MEQLADPEEIAAFQQEVAADGVARSEVEIERAIRNKLEHKWYNTVTATTEELNKRWQYEQKITRPYFHTMELTHAQLDGWRTYLEFEEREGHYDKIVYLYERCVVACALYEEFWLRYARWMSGQGVNHKEDVRVIYQRAANFVPISRPKVRLEWAYYEESRRQIEKADSIHSDVLVKLPGCIEVIISWANFKRRQHGVDEACQLYKNYIDDPNTDLFTKAALIAEWATALWKFNGAAQDARTLLIKNSQWYKDSRIFWEKWFAFEIECPVTSSVRDKMWMIHRVYQKVRDTSRLSIATKRELFRPYLQWLHENGDRSAMRVYHMVDRQINGYVFISA